MLHNPSAVQSLLPGKVYMCTMWFGDRCESSFLACRLSIFGIPAKSLVHSNARKCNRVFVIGLIVLGTVGPLKTAVTITASRSMPLVIKLSCDGLWE